MNYQLLEYLCPECGMLLKETVGELNQDLFTTYMNEECPKCGSVLETLKKVRKLLPSPPQTYELQYNKESNRQSWETLSQVPSSSSKFQIAYDEFISRPMFDIEALDALLQNLSSSSENTMAIIGNNQYNKRNRKLTNVLLTRLCIYSLYLSLRHKGFSLSSNSSSSLMPYVLIVDAGNSLDFYQFVEFIRQYGLDIKETLQRIVVSRAFTVHQLTNLIVNELPNINRQLDTCLIIVPDLLHMFTHDPSIDRKEAKYLIREIVSAIRKITISSSRTRCVVSWNHNNQSSFPYIKILLPNFDKCIEVASVKGEQSLSVISLRIYNGRSPEYRSNAHCLLHPRDLYLVPQF
jgi:DNA-directed RNA polymerase subunit RPC12/RpoP